MHDQANSLRELVRQGAVPGPAPPARNPVLLVITGSTRGVGTTTVAANLAVALARQGRRTLLADADPRGGNAADFLHAEPHAVLPARADAPPTIEEIPQHDPARLLLLPAASASDVLPAAAGCGARVGALPDWGGQLDFVVVDAGSGPTGPAREWCQAADVVFLVTTTEPASVMTAYASIKVFAAARCPVRVFGLVNRAPRRSVAREAHAQLARACQRFLAIRLQSAGYVADDRVVAEAGAAAQLVVTCRPRSPAARCFRRLAKTVLWEAKRSAVIR